MKNQFKPYWNTCLSIAAIIFSIVAICVSLPSTPELGIDYIGVIVGILSLLVTMLIGWQIYNVIAIDKKIDSKIEKTKKYLSNSIKETSDKMLEHIQNENDKIGHEVLIALEILRGEYFALNNKYNDSLCCYLDAISNLVESTHEEDLSMIDFCFEKTRKIYPSINKNDLKNLIDEKRDFFIKGLLKTNHKMASMIVLDLYESQNR